MGLRIIGRQKTVDRKLSEAERAKELEQTMVEWLEARGGVPPQDAKAEFMAHFCRVKARMKGPAEVDAMLQMARELRTSLKGGHCTGIDSHSKVDVATLLELL